MDRKSDKKLSSRSRNCCLMVSQIEAKLGFNGPLSHNDGHGGNMMMDKNDTTADSLILIDWDMTQYGYRKCFKVYRVHF